MAFSTLPTPIILLILEGISATDIVSLASTSRRTRRTVSDTILRNFEPGQDESRPPQMLPLLQLTVAHDKTVLDSVLGLVLSPDLILSDVEQLYCSFGHHSNPYDLFRAIRCLETLLKKLERIGLIHLTFQGNLQDMLISQDTSPIWELALKALCKDAGSRSCGRLLITNLDSGTLAAKQIFEDSSSIAEKSYSATINHLRLSALIVASRQLVITDSWLLRHVDDNPTLTSLSVGDSQNTAGADLWFRVLVKIFAVPRPFTELVVLDPLISTSFVVKSLSAVPHLKTLVLLPRLESPIIKPSQLLTLPYLTHLSASLAFAELFFGPPCLAPSIKSLEIALHPDVIIGEDTIRSLSQLMRQIRDVQQNISLGLSINSTAEYTLSSSVGTSLASGPAWNESFGQVTSITVHAPVASRSAQIMPRWLAMFPLLHKLTLDHIPDLAVPITSFLHQLSRLCPTLRHVEVFAQVYKPPFLERRPVQVPAETRLSLADLPEDILRLIFEDLSLELYGISVLCRQLNYVALSIALDRHGISDPVRETSFSINGSEYGAFEALKLAVWLRSIRNLRCAISPVQHVHFLLDAISQLRSYVDELSSSTVSHLPVFDFTLVFNTHNFVQVLARDPMLHYWVRVFGRLLDVVLSKSPTAISLLSNLPFLSSYKLASPGDFDWVPEQACMMDEEERFLFRRTTHHGSESPLIIPSDHALGLAAQSLKRLVLDGATFLVPPYLPWMLGVLRACSITSLAFINVPGHLSIVLAWVLGGAGGIPLSGVEKLHLSGQIHTNHLIGILRRFPQLKSLRVLPESAQRLRLHTTIYASNRPGLGAPSFPGLKSLTASLDLISYLLHSPIPFRQLTHLCIASHQRMDSVERIQDLICLFEYHGIHLYRVELDLDNHHRVGLSDNIFAAHDFPDQVALEATMSLIKAVYLHPRPTSLFSDDSNSQMEPNALMAWLRLFPKLEVVYVVEAEESLRGFVKQFSEKIRESLPRVTVTLSDVDGVERLSGGLVRDYPTVNFVQPGTVALGGRMF